MFLITHRLVHRSSARPVAGIRLAGAAPAATTRITFVLVNDTYLMADEVMADGKRRGGFARLAAVVKAERGRAKAEGRQVIFAHGGDTLSPSLVSGMQRGGDFCTAFAKAKPVLPAGDAPVIAIELIGYIKDIGTVRTGVDGRIVVTVIRPAARRRSPCHRWAACRARPA